MSSELVLWTVGHSNHEFARFAEMLTAHDIEFLADVRSYPYSRFAPHFNREELRDSVEQLGMRYVFMGGALGGRPERSEHFDTEGHALYSEMAKSEEFKDAIRALISGAGKQHRIALMCSCGRPDDCHRRLLVGKVLCENRVQLRHILPDGQVETEQTVLLPRAADQATLFGHDLPLWRSTRSVSHRRRLSTSLADSQMRA